MSLENIETQIKQKL